MSKGKIRLLNFNIFEEKPNFFGRLFFYLLFNFYINKFENFFHYFAQVILMLCSCLIITSSFLQTSTNLYNLVNYMFFIRRLNSRRVVKRFKNDLKYVCFFSINDWFAFKKKNIIFLKENHSFWKEGDCQVICGRVRSEGFLCRGKLKYRVLMMVAT